MPCKSNIITAIEGHVLSENMHSNIVVLGIMLMKFPNISTSSQQSFKPIEVIQEVVYQKYLS